MWEITAFAAGIILVFSGVLLFLATITWWRVRTKRLLIVALSFLAFFLKGIFLALAQLMVIEINLIPTFYLFDLVIITLLAFSLFTKG